MPETLGQNSEIWISDTTIRDGLQGYGIAFEPHEKAAIVRGLAEAGVPEIEVGVPSTPESIACIQRLVRAAGQAETMVLVRARTEDIDKAAKTNASRLDIVMGFSRNHLSGKFNDIGLDEALEKVLICLKRAQEHFGYVHIALEDATRTSIDDLQYLAETLSSEGANRISLPDTIGTANPWDMERLFAGVKKVLAEGTTLITHCHNDLGMAVANSLGAVRAGATAVSCTLAGIGERAGNTQMEAVLLALRQTGYQTSVNLEKLVRLSERMLRMTNFPIAPNTPVIGKDVHRVHSGMHAAALLNDPKTYSEDTTDLTEIGKPPTVALGPAQGTFAIRHLLKEEYGLDLEARLPGVVQYILEDIQRHPKQSYEKGRLIKLVEEFKCTACNQDKNGVIVPLRNTRHRKTDTVPAARELVSI